MKRDAIILAIFFGLCLLLAQLAKGVTLVWDPSPDSWVAGYCIYASTNSVQEHHLTNASVKVDCGTNTSLEITNLIGGGDQYYVATAYTADGQESLPSNEVVFHIPFDPPVLKTLYVEWSGTVPTTNWQETGFFRMRVAPQIKP